MQQEKTKVPQPIQAGSVLSRLLHLAAKHMVQRPRSDNAHNSSPMTFNARQQGK